MTRPRCALISLADTPWYHVINRCVCRAFLCGHDAATGCEYQGQEAVLSLPTGDLLEGELPVKKLRKIGVRVQLKAKSASSPCAASAGSYQNRNIKDAHVNRGSGFKRLSGYALRANPTYGLVASGGDKSTQPKDVKFALDMARQL